MARSRKMVKEGLMTEEDARGYVIAKMENLLRFVRENESIEGMNDLTLAPREAWIKGSQFVKLSSFVRDAGKINKLVDIAKEGKYGLREMEEDAGLKPMSAGLGSCMRCGRTLTDPQSVARMIGPECIKKIPTSERTSERVAKTGQDLMEVVEDQDTDVEHEMEEPNHDGEDVPDDD